MKKIAIMTMAAALVLSASSAKAQEIYTGSDPVGTISYALPQTVISLEVEAVKEDFHAGPYAKFAKKYLGIDVRQEDETSCTVSAVKMAPYAEADQSRRYSFTPGKAQTTFLALTNQGLVSFGGARNAETQWRFSTESKGDFSDRGVSSNLTSESATLYKNVRNENGYNTVAVQQQMVVEKSLETRAKEAAETIFNLREKKMDIVTGDTDATYSGEAMAAAIEEINRLEKEYMSLFIGYSDIQVQQMNYDVVPSADTKSQRYVAFRVSDEEGLVASDNVSGKPYLLELTAEKVSDAQQGGAKPAAVKVAYYRIPAICSVRLTDGVNILLQSRVPVYQLGVESSIPVQ